ncbi:hypothetical protein ACXR0O_12525 [Verrucomicrobiota bacterium sgz303538]
MKTKQKTAVESVAGLARFLEVTGSRSTWRNTVARVRYIHEQVRSGNYPNCQKLAEHIEICRRTE